MLRANCFGAPIFCLPVWLQAFIQIWPGHFPLSSWLFSPFKVVLRGTWVAQSVMRLTLAEVMISQFMSSSPASSSGLSAQSLLQILCPLSLCPSPTCVCTHVLSLSLSLSLSFSKINIEKNYLKKFTGRLGGSVN